MGLKVFSSIVWEAFQWIALLGGALGLVIGALLLFNSAAVFRLGESANLWISTRQAMRRFDEPITVERTVYRYHRIFGVLILACALYTLYVLALRFQGPELAAILASTLQLRIAVGIVESVRLFFVVVNVAALIVALAMIVRPSALKRIEEWANRRYSGRRAMKEWEVPRGSADRIVRDHPRLTGAVLCLAGLYIVLVVGLARFAGR